MTTTDAPKKYTIRKWPIAILVFIFLLGATGWYLYKRYIAGDKWKPLLQAKLKEMVLKSTDSLYHIEYSNFDLDLASGDATLSDFKLVPDSAVYEKLVTAKKAPDNLFMLSVKKLSIKNVGAKRAYQEKVLAINDITIDKPDLTIVNKRYSFNDTVKVGQPKTPYQIIKNIFKQLRIDSISLKDISVNYINKSNPVTRQTALKHLDIHISHILIDSLSALDPTRFYYTKGIEFILHDYKIATPDSMYNAELKRIYFSTAKREIILDNVNFLPRYNHADFYKKLGTSGDIFTLKFKKIAITDIDLQRFLRDQKLYAGIMDVADAKVNIYSNSNYKGKKSVKIGHDPHQSLQRVALDMKLLRLNIRHTDIIYSELDATTQQTGIIKFTNTNGYILNVTNDVDVKKVNPFMKASINTHFMDVAPLQVNFKFNLNAKDGAFNYSGTLGKFDGRILDKLVKPLALVHVQSADVDRLTFNVDANNYNGKGHLEFYYRNLNVQLLKKIDGQAQLQTQGLISKVANSLIIENDNPKKGVFRPGPIDLQREPTTSFFSFLYKGLLDGLKPSVGFDKKTEGKVNKVVAKLSTLIDKFNEFKEKRKQRKLERQTRRQAKKDSIANLKKQ
jgi:hypothetical protein